MAYRLKCKPSRERHREANVLDHDGRKGRGHWRVRRVHETGEQLCGRRHGQNGCSESGQRMKDCGNCSARSDGQLMSKVSVMDQRDVIEYPAYRHRASAAVRQRLWPPERLDTAVLMRWLLSPATNCQPARGFCHTIDSQLLPQSSNNEVLLHVSLLNIFM